MHIYRDRFQITSPSNVVLQGWSAYAEPACSHRSSRSNVCNKITHNQLTPLHLHLTTCKGFLFYLKPNFISMETHLRNRELKAEFWTIIVVKNRPEGILFQRFADFPHSDPHLLWFETKLVELVSKWRLKEVTIVIGIHLSRKSRLSFDLFVFPSSCINISTSKSCCLHKESCQRIKG